MPFATERTSYSGSSPEKRPTISRIEPPRGMIANTAEPLPVRRGCRSPAARKRSHSDANSYRRRPSNCSNRLPCRIRISASTRCRPTLMANLRWCFQGVKCFLSASCRRNASAVDTRHFGIAMSARNGASRRRRERTSPRPMPSMVPPDNANGTSDPSCNPYRMRSERVSLCPCKAQSATIAAAASALPPPMPACAGMRLTSVKRAPPASPSPEATSRAARRTRLLASARTTRCAWTSCRP